MSYSDNDVTHNYNANDSTKSNWSTLLISIVVLVLTR